jgi:hypothetical protein
MGKVHPWFCCLLACIAYRLDTISRLGVYEAGGGVFESLARRHWNIRVSFEVGLATKHMHIGVL